MKKILVVTLMLVMTASNGLAALNNNSYANKKSQRKVMHDFMQTLDKSTTKNWLNALDEATNKASEGKFQTFAIAVNSFINDYNKNIRDSDGNITDDSVREFLLKYCGIDLSNEDVGAIIGKDAGESLIELTAESIIPENVENIIYLDKLWNESPVSLSKINELDDIIAFRTPMSTLKFNKRGLDVVVANYEILDKKDKIIINGLYNWWIDGALDLIEKSYGLKFSNDDVHQIIYIDSFKIFSAILGVSLNEKTLAAANKNGNNLLLYVNKKYFDDNFEIKLNPSGKFEKQFFDRTIAHELTHAIMSAKIPSYAPNDYLFVTEGLAELTIGADDTRDLIKLLKNPERLANSFKNPNKSEYGYYGAGYMFFRYFAKQVADAKNIKTNQTMTFSQPKEIGSFVLLQVGHNSFEIKGAVYNSDRAKIDSYSGRTYYTNGIARFGDDKSEIWLHYNKNSRPAYCRLGGENFSDTILEDFSWGHKIFYIGGVNDFKFYALRSQFDMPSAQIKYEYNIIGRKPDGTWLKYFNTRKIIEKYIAKGYGYSMQDLNVSGDMIIIKYKILEYKYKKIYNGQSGELRFKWDDSAQWFDVEHIVY